MEKIKLLICGTRTFDDYEFFKKTMVSIMTMLKDKFPEIQRSDLEIVSGGAKGADSFAERFAERFANKNNILFTKFEADRDGKGKSAGYSRNIDMAEYLKDCPESFVIAFWDGKSKGTKNMLHLAMMYNYQRVLINYIDNSISLDSIKP